MKLFERPCTVYCILNVITNERYIGATINFSSRKRHHLSDLRLNKHGSSNLQEAYNSWGEKSFIFFPLEVFVTDNEKFLYSVEQKWIDFFHPKYNMNQVAGHYMNEKVFTPEAREKSRLAKIGRKQPQEEKDKRAISIKNFWSRPENIGKKIISEKQKLQLREANLGEKNPNWGTHRSQATRDKAANSMSKVDFYFLNENGEEIIIRNMAKFVRETGLWGLNKLRQGKIPSYRGWTFVKSEKISD